MSTFASTASLPLVYFCYDSRVQHAISSSSDNNRLDAAIREIRGGQKRATLNIQTWVTSGLRIRKFIDGRNLINKFGERVPHIDLIPSDPYSSDPDENEFAHDQPKVVDNIFSFTPVSGDNVFLVEYEGKVITTLNFKAP